MDVTYEEIVATMEQLYPEQFKVCMLTVANRNQAKRIKELESKESDNG